MNKVPSLWGFALDNLPPSVLKGLCGCDVDTLMADTPLWISLAELADTFGISTLHCNRVLEHQGWRDRHGQPTPTALDVQAAHNHGPGGRSRQTLWNKRVCSAVFKAQGYKARSRQQQVRQWAQFLEAMDVGSPSISTTADQMAADVPRSSSLPSMTNLLRAALVTGSPATTTPRPDMAPPAEQPCGRLKPDHRRRQSRRRLERGNERRADGRELLGRSCGSADSGLERCQR